MPKGDSVAALTEGRVVESGWRGGYGRTVVVESRDGIHTRYAHLNTVEVTAGERVRKNQVLGRAGSSGRATGPHLHLEANRNGRSIHPLTLLRAYGSETEKKNLKVSTTDDDKKVEVNIGPSRKDSL